MGWPDSYTSTDGMRPSAAHLLMVSRESRKRAASSRPEMSSCVIVILGATRAPS